MAALAAAKSFVAAGAKQEELEAAIAALGAVARLEEEVEALAKRKAFKAAGAKQEELSDALSAGEERQTVARALADMEGGAVELFDLSLKPPSNLKALTGESEGSWLDYIPKMGIFGIASGSFFWHWYDGCGLVTGSPGPPHVQWNWKQVCCRLTYRRRAVKFDFRIETEQRLHA